MRRINRKLLLLLVIIAFSILATQVFSPVRFERDLLYIQSGTRLWPVEVEIARTERQKEKGLMQRRRLAADNGMLFLSEEPAVMTMWMKDTLIPLDMLFINEKGVISHIVRNARPRSLEVITHDAPALAVLELPGGTAKRYILKPGDSVIHSFFKNERRK